MEKDIRATQSRATVEACNAIKAETFTHLPEEIELWRFREVLLRLRRFLGLSDGAVNYAIDLMGLLTEADWRGDGRPVTFHSLRGYARKVDKCERTITKYESQLIAAGLAHRTVKHARRHGGHGNAERRTGLDWRAFGVEMPNLLKRLDERNAHDQRCLDLETRIRSEKRIILGLTETAGEGRALEIELQLRDIGVSPLQACLCVAELEPILAALVLLRTTLSEVIGPRRVEATAVDKANIYSHESEQSESSVVLINTTSHSSNPTDLRSCLEGKRCREPERPQTNFSSGGEKGLAERDARVDAIPLPEIWRAAPAGWKSALGLEVEISWPALVEVAGYMAPQLGVSPYAWNKAMRILGPSEAALALMVLDRNQDHPERPVLSVGGALVGMTRRAGQGEFNLAPSLYGIMSRKSGSTRRGDPVVI